MLLSMKKIKKEDGQLKKSFTEFKNRFDNASLETRQGWDIWLWFIIFFTGLLVVGCLYTNIYLISLPLTACLISTGLMIRNNKLALIEINKKKGGVKNEKV